MRQDWRAARLRTMIALTSEWVERAFGAYAAGEAFGGLGKAGLITIIVVSLTIIVTLVWVFRETGRRE
jgi:hypothetical protein